MNLSECVGVCTAAARVMAGNKELQALIKLPAQTLCEHTV
jgi:hypothetical protein